MQTVVLLSAVWLSACAIWNRGAATPKPQAPVATLAPLPDLTIPGVSLEMQGRHGGCVTAYAPYAIRVTVENIGGADAPPFSVQLNQERQPVKDGLRAGQRIELEFTRLDPEGRYAATVDPSNQVAEADEENNARSYQAPTPTPPPLCTGEPAQTETPSPGG